MSIHYLNILSVICRSGYKRHNCILMCIRFCDFFLFVISFFFSLWFYQRWILKKLFYLAKIGYGYHKFGAKFWFGRFILVCKSTHIYQMSSSTFKNEVFIISLRLPRLINHGPKPLGEALFFKNPPLLYNSLCLLVHVWFICLVYYIFIVSLSNFSNILVQTKVI